MTQPVDPETLAGLREFDSATIFNALVKKGGLPNEEYTDHTIRCLLPELGNVIGYAVTAEVTTNDADSAALDWMDYYAYVEQNSGPLITVMKDVDARPGRGPALFGGNRQYLTRITQHASCHYDLFSHPS
jgi:4-hydroxy-4-methyl-2-oxoglutarate aldolase